MSVTIMNAGRSSGQLCPLWVRAADMTVRNTGAKRTRSVDSMNTRPRRSALH